MAKKTDLHKKFGKMIDDIMTQRNISRKELAEAVGISPAQLSNFINQGEKLSAERIDAIANYLGFELTLSEKKKLHHAGNGMMQRLKDIKEAVEQAMINYNHKSGPVLSDDTLDALRAPQAPAQHQQGQAEEGKA